MLCAVISITIKYEHSNTTKCIYHAKFFLLQNHWKMLKIHWVSFLGRNVEVDTLQKFIYNFIIGNNIQH